MSTPQTPAQWKARNLSRYDAVAAANRRTLDAADGGDDRIMRTEDEGSPADDAEAWAELEDLERREQRGQWDDLYPDLAEARQAMADRPEAGP